mmetsp:Transcript_21419/g.66802  ORF Transcript_21419/g.66802 Transcript_21419/m.66802 type:complete len:240 (-) Transcript_21419:96-815(-)
MARLPELRGRQGGEVALGEDVAESSGGQQAGRRTAKRCSVLLALPGLHFSSRPRQAGQRAARRPRAPARRRQGGRGRSHSVLGGLHARCTSRVPSGSRRCELRGGVSLHELRELLLAALHELRELGRDAPLQFTALGHLLVDGGYVLLHRPARIERLEALLHAMDLVHHGPYSLQLLDLSKELQFLPRRHGVRAKLVLDGRGAHIDLLLAVVADGLLHEINLLAHLSRFGPFHAGCGVD